MSKRQAEKDQLCAANFFLTVSTPPPVPDSDKALDHFKKTAKSKPMEISEDSVQQFCMSLRLNIQELLIICKLFI